MEKSNWYIVCELFLGILSLIMAYGKAPIWLGLLALSGWMAYKAMKELKKEIENR